MKGTGIGVPRYLVAIVGCNAISCVCFALAGSGTSSAYFWAAMVFGLVAIVAYYTFVYKVWAAIQDGRASISPAKAVALCFVPIFSIYWLFKIWSTLPQEYRGFAERHDIQGPAMPEQLYKAYPIVIMANGFISLFTILFSPVVLYFQFLVIYNAAQAINAVACSARNSAQAQPSLCSPPRPKGTAASVHHWRRSTREYGRERLRSR